MKNEYDYLNDVKMDFSCYEGETENKKRLSVRKKTIIGVCAAALTVTTAFASGAVGDVIRVVSTGYNRFYQYDSSAPQQLPDYLVGKLFDKDGNSVESIGKDGLEELYDENGARITEEKFAEMIAELTGGLVKTSDNDDTTSSEMDFSDIDEARAVAEFDIRMPEYLPSGYRTERIYAFKDENGNVDGKYVNIVFKNEAGKEIMLFERLINDETAFSTGTDGTIEEIEINGRRAVLADDRNLDFETEDSVSVGLSTKGNITRDELIKTAESIN